PYRKIHRLRGRGGNTLINCYYHDQLKAHYALTLLSTFSSNRVALGLGRPAHVCRFALPPQRGFVFEEISGGGECQVEQGLVGVYPVAILVQAVWPGRDEVVAERLGGDRPRLAQELGQPFLGLA